MIPSIPKKYYLIITSLITLVFIAIQQLVQLLNPTPIPFPRHTPSLGEIPVNTQAALVKTVIDGDTIELINGQKVRYIGINSPETHHPSKGVECFGKEAEKFNRSLVANKKVFLAKDVSETDKFGRLLRFVYLPSPDATGEALFVNQYLVEQGFAYAIHYPPDISQNHLFTKAQLFAEKNSLGLWSKCN